jgi:hypothetical protein
LERVLVMSVKVRRWALKVLARASEASGAGSRRVLKLVEGRLDGQLLAAHVEAQGGDGLVEEAVPGGAPGHGLLVEELLDLVVELVGLVLAQVLDPGAVMGEGLLVHGLVHDLVVDAVEFEPEEQKLARRRRQALLGVAVELRPHRVGGVAGIDEARIGHDAPRRSSTAS